MELTHFTEKNYMLFFETNREKMKLMPIIRDWINEKKKTLPAWDQYAHDTEGNIFHRFMLDENPSWSVVERDLRDLDANFTIKEKVSLTEKEIKEIAKEAWLSKDD